MSSFPVVVRDPLGQDAPETLAPGRANEAFTMSVRLRSSHRCDQCSSDIERRGAVHSWCEAAIAVVNDEPMRGGY